MFLIFYRTLVAMIHKLIIIFRLFLYAKIDPWTISITPIEILGLLSFVRTLSDFAFAVCGYFVASIV